MITNLVAFSRTWECFLPDFSLFLFLSFHSLYPHLFSRAYINFKNPEDILLFRDRFDGYVFIDNKGISWFCLNLVCNDAGHTVQAILLY